MFKFYATLFIFLNLVAIEAQDACRLRDLGIAIEGTPGPLNAITDVKGVEVGHTTLISGKGKLEVGKGPVRTGVTAILPKGKTYQPIFAAWSPLNGNGELTGTTWVDESGILEGPILITNTHSVGVVRDSCIAWMYDNHIYDPNEGLSSLPVVGETWDGNLNDLNGFHVKKEHVFAALNNANTGPVAEGSVGGGTGMILYQFKGGIGTSSRIVSIDGKQYTIGVLLQGNYGKRETLTILGVPVGKEIPDLMPVIHKENPKKKKESSIIVVVATDAPLLPNQLKRLTKRVSLGIGRMGGMALNSSGDIFIAFSTANSGIGLTSGPLQVETLTNEQMDPLFIATVQATEEAIINAMTCNQTMKGINDNTVYSIPLDRLKKILKPSKP
jgi:D-aminopeptidase